jgi:hypothetical protein
VLPGLEWTDWRAQDRCARRAVTDGSRLKVIKLNRVMEAPFGYSGRGENIAWEWAADYSNIRIDPEISLVNFSNISAGAKNGCPPSNIIWLPRCGGRCQYYLTAGARIFGLVAAYVVTRSATSKILSRGLNIKSGSKLKGETSRGFDCRSCRGFWAHCACIMMVRDSCDS